MANASIKKSALELSSMLLPLFIRKRLAVRLSRLGCIDQQRRSWWAANLLRDFSESDINGYHKFLWSNHIFYAATYEPSLTFGPENMKKSRRIFFSDLKEVLLSMGIEPHKDVRSAFEVGCSLGYQLKYMEEELFASAVTLEGVDIDEYAIRSGTEYLKKAGSKVKLHSGDMEGLERITGERRFDVVVCTGVLMYLKEASAEDLVKMMLRRGKVLAISGLAHEEDNSCLQGSLVRERDGTFVHNIDSMVRKAGGKVLQRRWEGAKAVDGHTIYFVFASK
ncbi:MAG: class I SAM-dependent methyltransferase [Deltaproteobacteria bacterium]|nr:class I SAM-dependent methyltransferase [Deltaproteobacteria bacterium]